MRGESRGGEKRREQRRREEGGGERREEEARVRGESRQVRRGGEESYLRIALLHVVPAQDMLLDAAPHLHAQCGAEAAH